MPRRTRRRCAFFRGGSQSWSVAASPETPDARGMRSRLVEDEGIRGFRDLGSFDRILRLATLGRRRGCRISSQRLHHETVGLPCVRGGRSRGCSLDRGRRRARSCRVRLRSSRSRLESNCEGRPGSSWEGSCDAWSGQVDGTSSAEGARQCPRMTSVGQASADALCSTLPAEEAGTCAFARVGI